MAKVKIEVKNTYIIDLDDINSKVYYNALRYAPYAETAFDKTNLAEDLSSVLMYNHAAVKYENSEISAAYLD